MKKLAFLTVIGVVSLSLTPAFAAALKTYQVTGPVLEMSADKLVVQKGKDKWEIARGEAKVPASVKVGSKVTILYTMTAKTVMAKDENQLRAKK